jgi:integrase
LRFHDLRHCCASLLLAQNIHPKQVQAILGYSQISTTLTIYSHLTPGSERLVADLMDGMLRADAETATAHRSHMATERDERTTPSQDDPLVLLAITSKALGWATGIRTPTT